MFGAMKHIFPALLLLSWDYPTNELSTNTTFYIIQSTNIETPIAAWTPITNVSGRTNALLSLNPGRQFLSVVASNIWSTNISLPASPVELPEPARSNVQSTIQKP